MIRRYKLIEDEKVNLKQYNDMVLDEDIRDTRVGTRRPGSVDGNNIPCDIDPAGRELPGYYGETFRVDYLFKGEEKASTYYSTAKGNEFTEYKYFTLNPNGEHVKATPRSLELFEYIDEHYKKSKDAAFDRNKEYFKKISDVEEDESYIIATPTNAGPDNTPLMFQEIKKPIAYLIYYFVKGDSKINFKKQVGKGDAGYELAIKLYNYGTQHQTQLEERLLEIYESLDNVPKDTDKTEERATFYDFMWSFLNQLPDFEKYEEKLKIIRSASGRIGANRKEINARPGYTKVIPERIIRMNNTGDIEEYQGDGRIIKMEHYKYTFNAPRIVNTESRDTGEGQFMINPKSGNYQYKFDTLDEAIEADVIIGQMQKNKILNANSQEGQKLSLLLEENNNAALETVVNDSYKKYNEYDGATIWFDDETDSYMVRATDKNNKQVILGTFKDPMSPTQAIAVFKKVNKDLIDYINSDFIISKHPLVHNDLIKKYDNIIKKNNNALKKEDEFYKYRIVSNGKKYSVFFGYKDDNGKWHSFSLGGDYADKSIAEAAYKVFKETFEKYRSEGKDVNELLKNWKAIRVAQIPNKDSLETEYNSQLANLFSNEAKKISLDKVKMLLSGEKGGLGDERLKDLFKNVNKEITRILKENGKTIKEINQIKTNNSLTMINFQRLLQYKLYEELVDRYLEEADTEEILETPKDVLYNKIIEYINDNVQEGNKIRKLMKDRVLNNVIIKKVNHFIYENM